MPNAKLNPYMNDNASQAQQSPQVPDDSSAAVGRRLREIRGTYSPKLSRLALAKRVGVSPKAIQLIEEGKTRHSRYLEPIARELGISLTWLTTGAGTVTPGFDDSAIALLPVMSRDGQLSDHDIRPFPRTLLGRMDGTGFMYQAPDGSMQPDIPRGAWLVASSSATPEPGRVVIAITKEHGPMLREWWDRGDIIELRPHNPAHATRIVARGSVRLLAPVIGCWVRY